MTSAPNQPISSARAVRRKAKARRSSSPRCNTQAMTLHLAEISAAVAPGAHAVLLLDQAGWHNSRALETEPNGDRLLVLGRGQRYDLKPGTRKRSRSEEHTSELQSLTRNSYAVFGMKTNKHQTLMRNPNDVSSRTKHNN